jgi:hypothetical protein
MRRSGGRFWDTAGGRPVVRHSAGVHVGVHRCARLSWWVRVGVLLVGSGVCVAAATPWLESDDRLPLTDAPVSVVVSSALPGLVGVAVSSARAPVVVPMAGSRVPVVVPTTAGVPASAASSSGKRSSVGYHVAPGVSASPSVSASVSPSSSPAVSPSPSSSPSCSADPSVSPSYSAVPPGSVAPSQVPSVSP